MGVREIAIGISDFSFQRLGVGAGRAFVFSFNDTATTEIYTLSLHDALPIPAPEPELEARPGQEPAAQPDGSRPAVEPQRADRLQPDEGQPARRGPASGR